MKKQNILIFSGDEIEAILPLHLVVDAVESYFKLYALNKIGSSHKYIYDIQGVGDIRCMPADDGEFFNLKILGGVDSNPTEGVNLSGVNVLFTHKSISCVSISDAKVLTGIRTGAAGAVAIKYLARKNSKRVTIIGAGNQGYWQMRGILSICKEIDHISVFDINRTKARSFSSKWGKISKDITIEPSCNLEKIVREGDIIITTTPSRMPIIQDKWISPGTHINAIGADTIGKEEIEGSLLLRSKVVVDDMEQALNLGELNVPFSKGMISKSNIYSTLGDIIVGGIPGRINNEEITLYDSTGLSFQDLAAHRLLFERAAYLRMNKKTNAGNLISL